MKKINIKELYYTQLQLLVKVSGKSQSKVINEVLTAGLIEVANKILVEHDDQATNNLSPLPAADRPEGEAERAGMRHEINSTNHPSI